MSDPLSKSDVLLWIVCILLALGMVIFVVYDSEPVWAKAEIIRVYHCDGETYTVYRTDKGVLTRMEFCGAVGDKVWLELDGSERFER